MGEIFKKFKELDKKLQDTSNKLKITGYFK